MQIAARNAFTAGGGGWVNPYVTDGLIAMWDGEWNAGGGVHDPAAATWTDLVSGNMMTFTGSVEWGVDHIRTLTGFGKALLPTQIDSRDFTIELVVARWFDYNTSYAYYSEYQDSGAYVNILFYGSQGYPYYNRAQLNAAAVSSSHFPFGEARHLSFSVESGKECVVTMGDEEIARTSVAGSSNQIKEIRTGYSAGGDKDMYCIRRYGRALTAAEIAANYAIDKARFNLP